MGILEEIMYRSTIKLLIGLAALVMMAAPVEGQDSAGTDALDPNGPRAVFPQLQYEFPAVMEGITVRHDFVIENHGAAPLVIKKISPD